MRVLISGAAGFVGSHLTDYLLYEGHEIIGLDNFITGHRRNVAHLQDNARFKLVEHDVTGFLHAPGDLDAMAASAVALLTDEVMHRRLAAVARDVAFERYRATKIVPVYESYYEETLRHPMYDRRQHK